MNKHQQISSVLIEGKDETDPTEYKFYVGSIVVEDKIWASIQRSATGEVLELWLNPTNLPTVHVEDHDNSDVEREKTRTIENRLRTICQYAGESTTDFTALGDEPVAQPLLLWRTVVEPGVIDSWSPS